MGETSSSKFSQYCLELSPESLYIKSMMNKNTYPIDGAIMEGVKVRTGVHHYDDKNRTVVELTFQGYNSSYVQVIDLVTASNLIKELKKAGIASTD